MCNIDFFRLLIETHPSCPYTPCRKWTVNFPPPASPLSIAQLVERRTVDGNTKQRSLGHWFKSGSREVSFLLGYQVFPLPKPLFRSGSRKETLLSNRIWTSDLRISVLYYQLQSSALPAELSRDGRVERVFFACYSETTCWAVNAWN